MTATLANNLLVTYYPDGTIDSVCVNPDDELYAEIIDSGVACAYIPAGSPASDIERLAPKPSLPSSDEIREELEADYLAEKEALAKFQTEERSHALAISLQLQRLFEAGCRIALLNPSHPNAEFIVRVSTAHDQLLLQAPACGGLYSDIYCVLEADEFSLRRYAPESGKRFSLAAAAYVRRCLYKLAFGRFAPSCLSEQIGTSDALNNCPTVDDEDAYYSTTHVALMRDKTEIGTILNRPHL